MLLEVMIVLVGKLLSQLPQDVLADDCGCGNHRTNLCEGPALAAIGLKLVSNLYMICCMFRMGATYLSLRLYVDNRLGRLTAANLIRSAPSAIIQHMIEEAKRYLLYHFANSFHWQNKRGQDSGDSASAKEETVRKYC